MKSTEETFDNFIVDVKKIIIQFRDDYHVSSCNHTILSHRIFSWSERIDQKEFGDPMAVFKILAKRLEVPGSLSDVDQLVNYLSESKNFPAAAKYYIEKVNPGFSLR